MLRPGSHYNFSIHPENTKSVKDPPMPIKPSCLLIERKIEMWKFYPNVDNENDYNVRC